MKKFNIFLFVVHFVSALYVALRLLFCLSYIADSTGLYDYYNSVGGYIGMPLYASYCLIEVIFLSILFACLCVSAFFLIKKSNILNFTRLTYEEYKEFREKKKRETQEKKAQKLQAELEKIKSTK